MTSINKGLLSIVSFISGSILSLSIVYFLQPNLHRENATNEINTPRSNCVTDFQIEENLSSDSTDQEANILLKEIIAQQTNTIEQLNANILNLSNQLASLLKSENIATDEKPPLIKMEMADFEDLTKEIFMKKFKGVVLSISGKHLESLKRGFEGSVEQDEKSLAYQHNISRYLLENNPYSEHYVDDLRCQSDICRLEISTSNEEAWEHIYAGMTREDWYTSITFEESSDFPGQHIYYLPNIAN